jgi:hypothetical protein
VGREDPLPGTQQATEDSAIVHPVRRNPPSGRSLKIPGGPGLASGPSDLQVVGGPVGPSRHRPLRLLSIGTDSVLLRLAGLGSSFGSGRPGPIMGFPSSLSFFPLSG